MGGNIHILVNCAGIQRRSPCLDFPEEDWDKVATNCLLSFSYMTSSTLGPRRESQVCLASLSGRWSPHGAPSPGKNHQLLLPTNISGWTHRSRLCRS
jgi:NAD(P)-dependent dehydrogenase (short-subunit alcohol dehydrogenase family)